MDHCSNTDLPPMTLGTFHFFYHSIHFVKIFFSKGCVQRCIFAFVGFTKYLSVISFSTFFGQNFTKSQIWWPTCATVLLQCHQSLPQGAAG